MLEWDRIELRLVFDRQPEVCDRFGFAQGVHIKVISIVASKAMCYVCSWSRSPNGHYPWNIEGFGLVPTRIRGGQICNVLFDLEPAVFEDAFYFVLVSPPPGSRGGSGLSFSQVNRWIWADSGPDPRGDLIVLFMSALIAAGLTAAVLFHKPICIGLRT